jgi:hypothetical protein
MKMFNLRIFRCTDFSFERAVGVGGAHRTTARHVIVGVVEVGEKGNL